MLGHRESKHELRVTEDQKIHATVLKSWNINIGDFIFINFPDRPVSVVELVQKLNRSGYSGFTDAIIIELIQKTPYIFLDRNKTSFRMYVLTDYLCGEQLNCDATECLKLHLHDFKLVNANKHDSQYENKRFDNHRWNVSLFSFRDRIIDAIIKLNGENEYYQAEFEIDAIYQCYKIEYQKKCFPPALHKMISFVTLLNTLCSDILKVIDERIQVIITKETLKQMICPSLSVKGRQCVHKLSRPLGYLCPFVHTGFANTHPAACCFASQKYQFFQCLHLSYRPDQSCKLTNNNYYNCDDDIRKSVHQRVNTNQIRKRYDKVIMENVIAASEVVIPTRYNKHFLHFQNQTLSQIIDLIEKVKHDDKINVQLNGLRRFIVFKLKITDHHFAMYQHWQRRDKRILQTRGNSFVIDHEENLKICLKLVKQEGNWKSAEYRIIVCNVNVLTDTKAVANKLSSFLHASRFGITISYSLDCLIHNADQNSFNVRFYGDQQHLQQYYSFGSSKLFIPNQSPSKVSSKLFNHEAGVVAGMCDTLIEKFKNMKANRLKIGIKIRARDSIGVKKDNVCFSNQDNDDEKTSKKMARSSLVLRERKCCRTDDNKSYVATTIKYSDIKFICVLGKGSFGEVWKVNIDDKNFAAKYLFGGNSEATQREIALLQRMNHPNILKLEAICRKPMIIVTELLEMDLFNYLYYHKKEPLNIATENNLITGIANGVLYLHEMNVIHRDLKSENILLDKAKHPRISDFGLSRKYSKQDLLTMQTGTFYTMAPEVISSRNYCLSSDIYSLAMVIYEIKTNTVPFNDLSIPTLVLSVVNGKRPDIGRDVFINKDQYFKWRGLITAMWDHKPENRPKAKDIISFIDNL